MVKSHLCVLFDGQESFQNVEFHFSPLVSGVIFQENRAHWWAWLRSPGAPSHHSKHWSSLSHLMRKTRRWIRITPRKSSGGPGTFTEQMPSADAGLGTPHTWCHPVHRVRPHRSHRRWNWVVETLRLLGNVDRDPDSFQMPFLPDMPYILRGLSLSPKTEPAMKVWITESPREFPSS